MIMPLSPTERKSLLADRHITQGEIARELRVTPSLVCHVMAGRRYWGRDTRRIMEHIAKRVEQPVEDVFPEILLGWGRTEPDPAA